MSANSRQHHGPGGPPIHHIMKKPKDFKKTIKFIWGYIKRRKWLLFVAVFMVITNIAASLAGTAYLGPIIDNFLESGVTLTVAQRFNGLVSGILVLIVIYSFAISATYFQSRLMLSVAQKTIHELRQDLFYHLQELPVRYYDTHSHGETMSRFTNDVDTLNDALNNSMAALFSSVLTFLGIIAVMLLSNWILTLLTLGMTPLLFFASRRIMKASGTYFVAQQKNLGKVNGYMEEIITGQKVVKVFNYENRAIEEMNALNEELRESSVKAQQFAGMMMPVMMNINTINYSLIAAVGGVFCVFGYFSIGGLVVFLQLARQFGRPINEASHQFNAVITAIAGAERIREVMEEKKSDPDIAHAARLERTGKKFFWQTYNESCKPAERIPVKGDVRFDGVTFSYEPEKEVLKNISLYAKPGQKIAFVGSTGAGKTTVINLITRFYDIAEGRISIDGIDIKDIEKSSLRKSMAVVLQDTHLFTGTVMENIRYGRLDASDAEVVNAAKMASAHGFISRLPQGYSTVIEGDGANLSQGQRQLINIARAAVADAPILILDEATSSIDTRTEKHIEEGLDRLMEGRTTFVIAHRLSTVRNADAIMVIENGEIIERGSHDDLIKLNGRYNQLYENIAELD